MSTRSWPCISILLIAIMGCGSSHSSPLAKSPQQPLANAGGGPQNAPLADQKGPDHLVADIERKIIFNGTLEVEVKDFAESYHRVQQLVSEYKAYFSKSEMSVDSGKKRRGTFTIKVPVNRFHSMVDALAALGNPLRNITDSQDVTEEYIDSEARLKNLKNEEEVLNRLLKETGNRLDELFKIREHIRINREVIERIEGRLKALDKLTQLSTITLTLMDHESYIAPTASEIEAKKDYSLRVKRVFSDSLASLLTKLETIGLLGVALVPWFPFLLLGFWIGKRLYRLMA